MNKFLLLRSNKQTGPYSAEELKEMGLKAYDLVWVEGKSAAWRYPGEIEDLKAFAPAVEEQPFDRFFKRPAQTNQPLFEREQTIYAPKEERVQASPKKEQEASKPQHPVQTPVFVNLPSNKVIFEDGPPEIRPQTNKQSIAEPVAAAQKEYKEYQPKPGIAPQRAAAMTPAAAQEQSQPYQQQVRPLANKKSRAPIDGDSVKNFIKPFAIGFALAAFLGIGIFIGININNRANNSPKDLAQKEDMSVGNEQTIYHPKRIPVATTPVQQNDKLAGNNGQATIGDQQTNAEGLPLEKKKSKPKPKLSDSLQLMKPKPAVDSSAILAVRNLVHATESDQTRKDAIKNKIGDYVALSGNKYNVGTFGGISELQLTISNKSAYPLDLVVVEVQYIQSNKKIFKTENIYFRNIGAGSALMEEAPKSTRGVKVQYKITLINSKELGLAYSGI